ncbi:AraC family transcriptional regulator [Flavobacterium sp. LS1R47]|uniref:AraC family transcriptional regulator n=1 Tax=Flavobacterium frigoritolerans TaxID=2987686 RepID=A0A9X3C0G1_9FLAO|nr:AraC family transcriptional regulator [Flavobacterium frigoritolerans]MCV9931570.1 AraC family transcriptional regulator [Flavobacterium frigoritolerans]
MSELIPEFKHIYSLTPEWRQDFINYLGGTIVDEKMYFSEKWSRGSSFFLEILPDVSVIIIDTIVNRPILLTRMASDDDFWIVYYDLSDSFSKHIVEDVNHKIGYKSKLNFGIVDNKIGSSYLATVGERFYSLRLLIRKSYIKTFFTDAEFEKDFKDVFDDKKKKMFFYGHIDSRSKVILHSLKQNKIDDPNYEFILKGAAFTLLGYLIERLNSKMPSMVAHLEKDIEAVMLSQQHLLSNLLVPFPGIELLANNANMSSTKYRTLYNTIFGVSPALYFKNEKLLLAKELLESGDFKFVSDVAYELGYNKTAYFSSIYKDYFGVLPNTVLKEF